MMPEPWPMGPFEREPRHRELSLPGPGSGVGAWRPVLRGRLLEALAGVELGAYDRRILDWLEDAEPGAIAVIAGWVKRARRDGSDLSSRCPGCDSRGLDVRQETNGDLVCHRCGRMVAPTEPE